MSSITELTDMYILSAPPIIKAIVGLSTVLAIAQVTPTGVDPSTIEQVSRLGVTGFLAVAVVVLWRGLQAKDETLLQLYRSNAESQATTKALMDKMSDTLDRTNETLDKMKETLDKIGSVRMTIGQNRDREQV